MMADVRIRVTDQVLHPADKTRNLTWFEIPVIMGMPFMCGKAKPFIVSPIAYPVDYIASITAGPDHHQTKDLSAVSTPEQSRCYSERVLRGILTLPSAAEQIQAFRRLNCPTPPGHSA